MTIEHPIFVEEEQESQMFPAALFVSLYLVVLAFFILLNSIAQREEAKQLTAIGSVIKKFSNPSHITVFEKSTGAISPVISSGNETDAIGYFEATGRLIKEELELADSYIEAFGNTLRVTVPIWAFFDTDSPNIKKNRHQFLENLASQLAVISKGGKLTIEFIIGYPKGEGKDKERSLAIKRASSFANMMASLGIEKKFIFAGISPVEGESSNFTLTFRKIDMIEIKQPLQE